MRKTLFFILLLAVLVLSGCSTLARPQTGQEAKPTPTTAALQEATPTPTTAVMQGGTENPDMIMDPAEFRTALVKALAAGETEKLQTWMTEHFLTGTWTADLSDTPPADALRELYADHLVKGNNLAPVEGADLAALLGGVDPLSIPSTEAGVVDAFLVSGWGQDGRDEAVLFVARQPDRSLKWHGWMVVNGGISGVRHGGVQPYQNEALGFSLYAPKDSEILLANEQEVMILAPGVGHPGQTRAAAFIFVEPANGRTAQQVVETVIAENGPGFNISTSFMGMGDEMAFVVYGLPGQDSNRQVFTVHNDRLYHMMFVPDNPVVGDAYLQMEDIYAQVVNTWRFIEN